MRHRQRVGKFMLKYGRVFPRSKKWTMHYLRFGAGVEPNHPIHRIPLEKMVEAIRTSKERDKRLEAAIEEPACDGADCRLPFRSQSPLSAGASEFLPHPPIPRNRHASEPL